MGQFLQAQTTRDHEPSGGGGGGGGVQLEGTSVRNLSAGCSLMLHAERLCFTQPLNGKRLVIEAPAPF